MPWKVLVSLLLAAMMLATSPVDAQTCRWNGTAPFCSGECGDGESEITRSSSGNGAVQRLESSNPFGQDCATGSKAYCCKVPGAVCRWDGTAPFCDGECRKGETAGSPPSNVISSGKACLTGSKVYCCRSVPRTVPITQALSTSPEYSRFAALWEKKAGGPELQARHGLSGTQYQQAFDDLAKQGFHLVDVSGYAVANQETYAAIWEKGPTPEWQARHGLTSAQHQQTFDQLVQQGFRPIHVSGYVVGGQDRYASIWIKGGGEWQARHGLTGAQYQQAFDDMLRRGFRLIDVSGYALGGEDRYAAIWEKANGPVWQARHGMTSDQYQQQFDALGRDGYRLQKVRGWGSGDTYHYAAIWAKTEGPPWVARHGMLSDAYQEEFNTLGKDGYRLKTVSGYQGAQ